MNTTRKKQHKVIESARDETENNLNTKFENTEGLNPFEQVNIRKIVISIVDLAKINK